MKCPFYWQNHQNRLQNRTGTLRSAAACALFLLLCAASADAGQMQVVRGHIPAAVARSETAGVLPASNQLHLTLALPLRNREALTNFLQDIYKPGSAYYRHYLTPEQFAERFAPPEKDYQAAIAFAKSKGLTVTATHPNRTLLDVTGSVAAIEKAFHLRLRTYRHPS